MVLIRRDVSEVRWTALWLLPKQSNPEYWNNLFKNLKAFFYGMGRSDLIEALDIIIYEKIEKPMGVPLQSVLITYKNLPFHNSFTRSRNPLYKGVNIYKYTVSSWLDEIEQWGFEQAMILEKEILFSLPSRQWV